MGRLIYSALCSLDLYVADADGNFEWAAPGPEVHAAVNDLLRPARTQLYGRRIYDVLKVWETIDDDAQEMRDFATLWRAANKIVYSRALQEVSTARTRIEREFDPDAIRALKAAGDVTIGGPELAGQALAAGLVDEIHLFLNPVLIGAGTPALPDGVRVHLDLAATRTFDSGVVYLHYRLPGPD